MQTALGMDHLTSLKVSSLSCKSWIANEFFDALCSYDMSEQGLEKLTLWNFDPESEPFENEVISRLANICPRLTYLKLSAMSCLSEAGRLSMASLFRQIIQNSPPIEVLDMEAFSPKYERHGEDD